MTSFWPCHYSWCLLFQRQLFADILQNLCSSKVCRSHRKHLCLRFCFNKVGDLHAGTSLRKRDSGKEFSCEFCKIFKETYFVEHLQATSGFWRSNNSKWCKNDHKWTTIHGVFRCYSVTVYIWIWYIWTCYSVHLSMECSDAMLVNPSHTDESWVGQNTRMWIYMLWIYSLSTLENTDENKIFLCSFTTSILTSVVLYSLTWATLMSPG